MNEFAIELDDFIDSGISLGEEYEQYLEENEYEKDY